MYLSRRAFLLAAAAWALPVQARPRAPFRRLLNNDTTNLAGCTSPWHPRGAPFSLDLLKASVDEVTGCTDVHLLAPGLCEIPWWPGKVLPLEEHVHWSKARYGLEPDAITRQVLEGADLCGTFIQRCRERGQAPFLSFRLNDVHHKEHVDHPGGPGAPRGLLLGVSRWYHDHPEFRVGTRRQSGSQNALNFAHPEVRARKLAFISELLQLYSFAGIELDFLRYYSFFPASSPDPASRLAAMLEIIRGTRAALGLERWFSVRIPCHAAALSAMGIDLPAFAAAGVDMFNLASFYCCEQQTDFATLTASVPGAATYVELTQTTRKGPHTGGGSYDDFAFQRTTPEQMRTTAHLAYTRGCAGVSTFNFQYFREHGKPGRGDFGEPPFNVLRELADPEVIGANPAQHYYFTQVSDEPRTPGRALGSTQKPASLTTATPLELTWQLAPPAGGWTRPAVLRLQAAEPLGASRIKAHWSGTPLATSSDAGFPIRFPSGLEGSSDTLQSWTVPHTLLAKPPQVTFTIEGAGEIHPVFIDLLFPDPLVKA